MRERDTLYLTDFLRSADERARAAEFLRSGGLVVMPTETVYGLAANALDPLAVASIYVAKGRPSDNPLIVHIASVDALESVTAGAGEAARRLFARFSPGPLTLVLPRSPRLPATVTGGLETVGIRIPSHPAALALIEASGLPLAAPSANRSGRVSPTSFAMARVEMAGRVDAIIDGGDCAVGLESTVARVTDGAVVILRPGAVTLEMIRDALPGHAVSFADESALSRGIAAPSPGMRYAHYRPDAAVYCWHGGPVDGIGERGTRAVIGLAGCAAGVDAAFVREFESVEEYSARFFATLSECDAAGMETIIAQAVREEGLGAALMNRLRRASAGKSLGL